MCDFKNYIKIVRILCFLKKILSLSWILTLSMSIFASKTHQRLKLLTLILLLMTILIHANKAMTQSTTLRSFNGFYNGINLNIQCRSSVTTPWKACECIDSVKVNGETYSDILYEGYQVDLANKTELEMHEAVSIQLFLSQGCELRFLNPSDFTPAELKPVSLFELKEDHSFYWKVSEIYPDLRIWVQIEQFRWGRWVKLGQNYNITGDSTFTADFSQYFLRGENRFRAVVATIDHQRIPSQELVFKSKRKKIKAQLKSNQILFTRPAYYEIYSDENLIGGKGMSATIKAEDIHGPDGTYIVYYGNCEMRLQKEGKSLIRLK